MANLTPTQKAYHAAQFTKTTLDLLFLTITIAKEATACAHVEKTSHRARIYSTAVDALEAAAGSTDLAHRRTYRDRAQRALGSILRSDDLDKAAEKRCKALNVAVALA